MANEQPGYRNTWQYGDVTLKEHFDTRLRAIEQAIQIATAALDKRLDGMNEFRATLKDQATTFVSKESYEITISDIRYLREALAESKGKASQYSVDRATLIAAVGIVLGLVGTAVSLIGLFTK